MGRVASVQDVVAQGVGAGIGIVLWIVLGEWFVLRLAAAAQVAHHRGTLGPVALAVPAGRVNLRRLPAGLPVTSPKQLLEHYRDGQLCLMPFADCPTWGDVARDAFAGVVLFFPVGLWGSLAFRRAGQPLRSVLSSTANGAAFAAPITVLRVLCSPKMTDSSWIVTGVLGSALGAAALQTLTNS